MFHVENQSGKKGDIVSVPVTVESGEEVGGFDITVYYDGDTLEFRSLKWGELTEDGGLYDYNHKEDNHSVKIIYVTADTIQANGTVAVLEFVLKKDCTEELPIGIGDREVVGNEEDSPFVPSSVTGVDEAFQNSLEESVSDSGTSVSQTSGVGQTEESTKQTGAATSASGRGESEGENQESEETVNIKREDGEKTKKNGTDNAESEENGKNNFVVSVAVGIGCAVVMIAAALWILRKRKRNKK